MRGRIEVSYDVSACLLFSGVCQSSHNDSALCIQVSKSKTKFSPPFLFHLISTLQRASQLISDEE